MSHPGVFAGKTMIFWPLVVVKALMLRMWLPGRLSWTPLEAFLDDSCLLTVDANL